MIKYCDVVEEDQPSVGDAGVVRMRIRNPLAPAGDAVAEESDRAAAKWRELVFVVDAKRSYLLAQQAGRIGRGAIETQRATRIEADERVSAEMFAALDRFKEKRI